MFDRPNHVLELWIAGINSCNLHVVIGLYDKNAVLLPTFSNKCLSNLDAIRSYFEILSSHKELHVELHDKTLLVQRLSNELFSMSGIYCWRFEVEGEILGFEARFTFIINKEHPNPIIHHHSSQVPRML